MFDELGRPLILVVPNQARLGQMGEIGMAQSYEKLINSIARHSRWRSVPVVCYKPASNRFRVHHGLVINEGTNNSAMATVGHA